MNPQELFKSDGKSAGVWFCDKCKLTHGQLILADQCCDPKCQTCGTPCKPYYTLCDDCLKTSRNIKESERFKEAEKIPEHQHTSGVFYGDEYHESVADFRESHDEEEIESIHYLWAATPEAFVYIDAERLLESVAEDGYDGFSTDDLNGVAQLLASIEVFNEANKGIVAYSTDYTRAVILEKQP